MVSIIIPVYNQHEVTKDCLEAIERNTAGSYEVIIVDNGSEPSLLSWEPAADYCVIRNQENLGFPAAINQGIKASTGSEIVILNNDVIVSDGWLGQLLYHLMAYDIVGPMTNYAAGIQRITIPAYHSFDDFNIQSDTFHRENYTKSIEVNWVIGFCMMFSRKLFDTIGPFDESLWPCSGEELDFCLHARSIGKHIGVAMDTYVHHYGSKTFTAMSNEVDYNKLCTRNETHVAERWGEFWTKQCDLTAEFKRKGE